LLEGNRSIFSRALQTALRETLGAGQQAILFLNRRGAASFVICRDCGHVMECRRCELPLSYHSASSDLVCHHCNRREPVPRTCPACGGVRIRYFGLGTQKVEEAAQEMFPGARMLRWDRDVTRYRGAHDAILEQFSRGEADVLIGTQMVAKGLDLPRVTLVGVISADTSLYLPDFRAGERTFQLLTQVAGRAGRSVLGGKVIVQTYTPQQACIQAARGHDYAEFYRQETAFRREHAYPPFSRMARLLYADTSLRRCREESARMREYLDDRVRRLGLPWVTITGPAPCFLPRLRGKFRWHILVRCDDLYPLLANLAYDLQWRVDVEPVEFV
jgi:primosomal protein N' (replication factor Y)